MTEKPPEYERRHFLKIAMAGVGGAIAGTAGTAIAATSGGQASEAVASGPVPVPLSPAVKRTWLGSELWGNRLQDWQLNDGRIECLNGGKSFEVRTVALLTRALSGGPGEARLRMRFGRLSGGDASGAEDGFCGFLIGVGEGRLDYRAAALAQRGSGMGGGLMAVSDAVGRLSFREHQDEADPLAFKPFKAKLTKEKDGHGGRCTGGVLELLIRVDDAGAGQLTLRRFDDSGKTLQAEAVLDDVNDRFLQGGLLLVSSPERGKAGARWWFSDIETAGGKVAVHPERSLGAVLGGMYSLNGPVLRMTAQMMPIGKGEPQEVTLHRRLAGTRETWVKVATSEIEHGFVALFRLEDWDSSRDWDYMLSYRDGAGTLHSWSGIVRKDPGNARDFTIALFSCLLPVVRPLEDDPGKKELPQARFLGRYTPGTFYFPHSELLDGASSHDPDMAVFCGDQYYEYFPSRKLGVDDGGDVELDTLYKWYLWYWPHRDFLKSRPSIVLVDDHDVYHGNLWGQGGGDSPEGNADLGGYVYGRRFVNMVQRMQCGHNPDPYDPNLLETGVGTYYTAFQYGGIDFALLEDRKFKTSPVQGESLNVHVPQMLGTAQEAFLADWAARKAEAPRIVLTQTVWASVQTSPDGQPLLDFDSNGYPTLPRQHALSLVRDAGALMLAGDQHMSSLVRHGIDAPGDGPVQFAGPAGGARWQRWFEPGRALANSGGDPNTGDFRDAFGNHVRVLAVANPKITFVEYRRHRPGRNQALMDRQLKSEGYGIVRVRHGKKDYVIECWPWNTDADDPDAAQYQGWPYTLPFDEVSSEGDA